MIACFVTGHHLLTTDKNKCPKLFFGEHGKVMLPLIWLTHNSLVPFSHLSNAWSNASQSQKQPSMWLLSPTSFLYSQQHKASSVVDDLVIRHLGTTSKIKDCMKMKVIKTDQGSKVTKSIIGVKLCLCYYSEPKVVLNISSIHMDLPTPKISSGHLVRDILWNLGMAAHLILQWEI